LERRDAAGPGAGPSAGEAAGQAQVLTVARGRPAVVALDAAGAVLERIEA
jgi:hypothetical protein